MDTAAAYSSVAWFYHQHWGSEYYRWAFEGLDRILPNRLTPGARILGLGCGARGFDVTVVDSSAAMQAYARLQCAVASIYADARDFRMPGALAAAIATFDTLHCILEPEGMYRVFHNVHSSLEQGAP
jgi:hypothetical protein